MKKASTFLFLSILVLLGASRAHAQTNSAGSVFPAQPLRKIGAASEIPSLLGAKFSPVAAWYGRTAAELRLLCLREKSLRCDREGRLHFVCRSLSPIETAVAASSAVSSGGTTSGTPTTGDALFLHSKPGASKIIYLDFDGHVTSGSFWNSSYTGGGNIVTPPYTTDSTLTASFSPTELNNIISIWRAVAEDFAAFDVDVTTQDPGIEALRKTSNSDTQFGMRVCIGGSSYDWFGAGAGGIAYLNSFAWNSDTPCFVFTAQLGNGNPKYTAEAVSHETGHTFNLNHDGRNLSATNPAEEYYEGHANWAPIMGSGYYKDVVQWSRGEYAFASNTQDDTALISSVTGYRTDDSGDSIIDATPLTGTTPVVSGIIESRLDADLFQFSTGSGTITLTATPAPTSPNLDIRVSLYDGLGNLHSSSNPTTLGASLTTTLPQGTYYAAVEGVGTGDPTAAYNDYGSTGEFTFSGSLRAPDALPPVAIASATPVSGTVPLTVSFRGDGSSDPDGSIAAYDWDFGDGSGSTAANPSKTYSVPGTYAASLVVVDNSGLSSTSQPITITVGDNKFVYVANIAMTVSTSKTGYAATATVTVRNQAGQTVPNATVAGDWSGLITGSTSKATGKNGSAALTSVRTKNRGTFTFTVTGITISGSSYNASKNVETSDSIATP